MNSVVVLCLLTLLWVRSADAQNEFKHRLIQTVDHKLLVGVCGTAISPDGKHLYASTWKKSSILEYRRIVETGELIYAGELTDKYRLWGTTSVEVHPNGKLAAACAWRDHSVSLMNRDEATGALAIVDTKTRGEAVDGGRKVAGVKWAVDVKFSVDGLYAYFAESADGIAVFKVADPPALKFVEHFLGGANSLIGCREVALHPSDRYVYAASAKSSSITALDRNRETGTLQIKQVVRDGKDSVNGISGMHGLTCSADGKYLFAVSGRFDGDSSVGCYKIDDNGRLTLVNELINGVTKDFSGFLGGNNIAVSPDGKNIYATGTRSGVLAVFQQDSETGRISFQEFLKTSTGKTNLGMAAGVSVSADGKYVYVGSESYGQILVYGRNH